MSWERKKFIDFILLQRGYDLTQKQIIKGNYPVVTSTSILGYHNAYKANGPGVITGRSGTIGKVLYIESNYWPHNTSLYVKDFKGNDPKFVYYFMRNFGTARAKGGSAVPTLNKNNLSDIDILVPTLDLQKKIVNLLLPYDKLIENNQKQIKLLEEAAQRLYKEWFVDLHFPGYEDTEIVNGIPKGWKKDRVDSFFKITIGKTPPREEKQCFEQGNVGVPWVSISDMGNTSVYIFNTTESLTTEAVKKHNMKIVSASTIFVSFKLTIGRVAIATTDMCTNEAIAHFYIENDFQRAYVYCYLNNFEYDTLGNTSSISKAINSKIIKAMPFIMPDDTIVKVFDKQLRPIFNEIKIKQNCCIKLAEARDRLLPKLMSGELTI